MSSGGGGGGKPMTTSATTNPNAGAGGLGNLVNAMFGQFGINTDPMGGYSGKDRHYYNKLLQLRASGKKFDKQAKIERRLGLAPGGSPNPFTGGGGFGGGGMPNLAGIEFNPELNPFLQKTFENASDLTRTRLSSEFAGAGRNPEAAYPARSQELQHLAGKIFDPAYLAQFDSSQTLINRLGALIPMSGQNIYSTQKKGYHQQGLL